MSFKDLARSMLDYFPLRLDRDQQPIAITPTGSLVNGTTNSAWPIVLGAGGSADCNFLIPNDCDLEISQWVASTSGAGYPNTLGFNFSMYYGNRNFQLNQAPLPGELVFGTAQRPGHWSDRPWRLASSQQLGGQSNLAMQVTNTSGATITIYFALLGWRSAPSQAARQAMTPQRLQQGMLQQGMMPQQMQQGMMPVGDGM